MRDVPWQVSSEQHTFTDSCEAQREQRIYSQPAVPARTVHVLTEEARAVDARREVRCPAGGHRGLIEAAKDDEDERLALVRLVVARRMKKRRHSRPGRAR